MARQLTHRPVPTGLPPTTPPPHPPEIGLARADYGANNALEIGLARAGHVANNTRNNTRYRILRLHSARRA